MKKFVLTIVGVVLGASMASAQLGVFNHIGADLSVSTTGIGLEVSTPITDFIQMRAGFSTIPGVTFNSNINGRVDLQRAGLGSTTEPFSMQLKGDVSRTQGDVIFNVYPFGKLNSLYVAAGAYFGGKSIIKLEGYSPEVADYQEQGILNSGWVEVGDYKLEFEDKGTVRGGLCASNFRPYLGLGYGRPCPSGRLGFMVEMGVQFMGHMKICQGKDLKEIDMSALDNNDDWQKWMDKLAVYPVLKFSLTGRIF